MIDGSIMRIDAMLAFLGGRASLAGVISDPGLSSVRPPRLRSRAGSLTAVTIVKPAHQGLCLKANSPAASSHLALQAEP
jgi:hypothetical protein